MELKKKKLLVIIQGNVGGAERMAVTVTKGLDPQLYDMTYYLEILYHDIGKSVILEKVTLQF